MAPQVQYPLEEDRHCWGESDGLQVGAKVDVWSKSAACWCQGEITDKKLGMTIKIVVEYYIPSVGRAQKSVAPTSPNLRLAHGRLLVKPGAETQLATACAEVAAIHLKLKERAKKEDQDAGSPRAQPTTQKKNLQTNNNNTFNNSNSNNNNNNNNSGKANNNNGNSIARALPSKTPSKASHRSAKSPAKATEHQQDSGVAPRPRISESAANVVRTRKAGLAYEACSRSEHWQNRGQEEADEEEDDEDEEEDEEEEDFEEEDPVSSAENPVLDDDGAEEEDEEEEEEEEEAAPSGPSGPAHGPDQQTESETALTPLEEGSKIANGRYKVHQLLGAGSFSSVRLGKDVATGEEVAIKLEEADAKYPQLLEEAKRLQRLSESRGFLGIPCVHWVGSARGYNLMVLERLGPSLEAILSCGPPNKGLSPRSVLDIAVQMLDIMQHIHRHGLIHRDMKPNNICSGLYPNNAKVYCIDFGLAKDFENPSRNGSGKQHIPYRTKLPFVGTVRYSSIGAQLGHEQSRRDDLEALLYVLVYLLHGYLPWQGLGGETKEERRQNILDCKQAVSPEELVGQGPSALARFLKRVKALKFTEVPPYGYLRSILATGRSEAWTAFEQGREPVGGRLLEEMIQEDDGSSVSDRRR